MIAFWLSAAALAVAALVVLLRPFLRRQHGRGEVSREAANIAIYRDQVRELDADLAAGTLAQADYDRSRREIEARLIEDMPGGEPAAQRGGRGAALAVGIALPLLAAAIYFAVGEPRSIAPTPDAERFEVAMGRLAAHLRENPDDGQGWRLLGRSYVVLGRFDEAVEAYKRATARFPRDAQLFADYADALAMARGRTLEGEPEKLILHALELDPQNLKALALAGTVAFDRGDFARAAAYWKRMLPLVQPGSEDASTAAANVAEAERLAGTPKAAAGAQGGVSGKVTLSPALRKEAQPDDVLFVFARASEGPPMPLAVMRARAKELPLAFALDDSMAMAPGLALSKFPRVVVSARISRSGQPTAQAGDLQGTSAPVSNDEKNVSVVIDTVVR
jgi:cytochrome c-type biogenesis protein CcmH